MVFGGVKYGYLVLDSKFYFTQLTVKTVSIFQAISSGTNYTNDIILHPFIFNCKTEVLLIFVGVMRNQIESLRVWVKTKTSSSLEWQTNDIGKCCDDVTSLTVTSLVFLAGVLNDGLLLSGRCFNSVPHTKPFLFINLPEMRRVAEVRVTAAHEDPRTS